MEVFLADDDIIALNGLERMIHWDKIGAKVIGTALTGTDALTQIKKLRPQIVLSDIKMPGIDGLELSRYLHEYYPEIRVILISGHSEFEYAQQAIKYQVVDYILKPITREKILEIENLLTQLSEEMKADRTLFSGNYDDSLQAQVFEALRSEDGAMLSIL